MGLQCRAELVGKVRLDYTTLKPLPKGAPAQENELWIYADSQQIDFDTRKQRNLGACAKIGEAAPGVTSYRSEGRQTNNDLGCSFGEHYTGYLVANEQNQDIAYFDCTNWKEPDTRIICSGTVSLSGRQSARLTIITSKHIV